MPCRGDDDDNDNDNIQLTIRTSSRQSPSSQCYQRLTDTNMTTYIPSLTLPSFIFENAAASILLPVAAGTAVGFSTRRMYLQQLYAVVQA